MANSKILIELRNEVTDESASLAGLLRKCILLGAETGSSKLKDWAKQELDGYEGVKDVPSYRIFPALAIIATYTSIAGTVSNETWSRFHLGESGSHIKDRFVLRNNIEEIEDFVTLSSIVFTPQELILAKMLFNADEENFHSIVDLHYVLPRNVVTGVLSQVRTKLVEIVAELSSNVPMEEIPKKDRVDFVVSQTIGSQYNANFDKNRGSVSFGPDSQAVTNNGVSTDEVVQLIESLKSEAMLLSESDERDEIVATLDEIKVDVKSENKRTSALGKVNRLKQIVMSLGSAAMMTGVTELTKELTGMILPN